MSFRAVIFALPNINRIESMLKMAIAYVHLLATCMALGSIFIADWRLLRGREFALRPGALARLATTQRMVNVSLLALWITGAR
jgi:hypothetical protein